MKHLIMGTAGHVDHGKTALVKALTGVECDTHREERARGITINLGFAHLELKAGVSLGIVDVPGHRDFVHTMVGGASGVDFVCLVIAADSGVMPQTIEHLQIMDVLGVRDGLIALTKVDLMGPELAAMAEEEAAELVQGTFLDGCPIVHVSSVTGEGLDRLRESMSQIATGLTSRPAGEVFRLFPDRVFTVSGFGTVVTGSVLGGSLATGSSAYLLPGGERLRVRRLERHGREVPRVVAGDRASINLVGLDREDVERGMVVADRVLNPTELVDVRLRLFEHARGLRLWSQVIFHVGTYEKQARVHLIDHDRMLGGETGLAQIHLTKPCVIQYGDRFVLRGTSSDATLGGGEVIDPAPLHHRRRTAKAIDSMMRVAEGERRELVAAEIRKRHRAISHRELADVLAVASEELATVVDCGLPEDIVVTGSNAEPLFVVKKEYDRLQAKALRVLAGHHRRHPLHAEGQTAEELSGRLGIGSETTAETLLQSMLERLEADRQLKRIGHTWALREHEVVVDAGQEARIRAVEDFLKRCGMKTPLMSQLRQVAEKHGMAEHDLNHILGYLVEQGRACFFDGEYLHASIVDRCRRSLVRELARAREGMTVAQFRNLVRGNRKICLILLGIFDAEGVTERVGDVRLLAEKGRKAMAGS